MVANLTFGPACGDGMVLQREGRAVVWGWADPGTRLVFTLTGETAEAVAGPEGRWTAVWTGLAPGGPHELFLDGRVLFRDVWVGDLWICAGQSNMERSLETCEKWPDEALRWQGDPGIRQLFLPNQFDFREPRSVVSGARWAGADSPEVVRFSAAGFHAARELRARTGVPQGLVQTAVGGSAAQAWLSAGDLEAFPPYRDEAAQFAVPGWLAARQKDEELRRNQWYAGLDAADPKDPRRAGVGPWTPGEPPGRPGSVWLRREFVLPAAAAGVPGRLRLGTLVDGDDTWVNGTWVGSTGYQYPSRRYQVPAGTLREGANTVLVRAVAPRGRAGLTAGKVRCLEAGALTVDLADGWEWREGTALPELPADTFLPMVSLGLHNGILAPLAPLSPAGVFWYQGESNTGSPGDYPALMETLIGRWRKLFDRPDLPFVLVQLPLIGPATDAVTDGGGWAPVREFQRQTSALPGTALVPILDLGEWNDLHPADKQNVGRRIALAARKLVLGEDLETWTGPLVAGASGEGPGVRIRFTQAAGGLATRDGRAPGAFFLAGADGVFHRAGARIEGETVLVQAPEVPRPAEVRYAWAANPAGANLVNRSGLTASPFRAEVTTNR